MVNKIDIRKVKKGDEKILAYIQTESWKSAFYDILSEEDLIKYTNIERATEMYTMLLEKKIGNGFILSVDNEPHCIAYWDAARDEECEGEAELICIHSLCTNWGKGYGSEMMKHIMEEIKKAGYYKVMLWVFEKNIRARKFYEKHGFVFTGDTKQSFDTIEMMYSKKME